VVVELLVGDLDPARLGEEDLGAPHLLDSEVMHVLRGLVLRKALSASQAATAVDGFLQLAIERFSADWLRPRIWELRSTLTGYDATYVALAEQTGATALVTTDGHLARAPGPRCTIHLL
jgi:predicted nucleic acid-binding protein